MGDSADGDWQFHQIGAVYNFKADLFNLTSTGADACIESSPFSSSGLQWTIELCKRTTNSLPTLDMALKTSMNQNITCQASATSLLSPASDEDLKLQTNFDFTYTADELKKVKKSICDWEEFIRDYTKNGFAYFEFKISTQVLKGGEAKGSSDGLIHIRMDHINETLKTVSDEVIVGGIRWEATAEKQGKYLAVNLHGSDDDIDQGLSYTLYTEFRTISFENVPKVVNSTIKSECIWGGCDVGPETFLEWESFENDYVQNNRSNILIKFKIGDPKSLWSKS